MPLVRPMVFVGLVSPMRVVRAVNVVVRIRRWRVVVAGMHGAGGPGRGHPSMRRVASMVMLGVVIPMIRVRGRPVCVVVIVRVVRAMMCMRIGLRQRRRPVPGHRRRIVALVASMAFVVVHILRRTVAVVRRVGRVMRMRAGGASCVRMPGGRVRRGRCGMLPATGMAVIGRSRRRPGVGVGMGMRARVRGPVRRGAGSRIGIGIDVTVLDLRGGGEGQQQAGGQKGGAGQDGHDAHSSTRTSRNMPASMW